MPALPTASPEHCNYCGIPVGRPWPTQRGFRYGDGRVICRSCHETAIKTAEQLQAIWRHVVKSFNDLGLRINWNRLPVGMLDQPDIRQKVGRTNVIGFAESQICQTFVDSKIGILYGMPTLLAIETLAHEAGHVWCREQQVRFSPPDAEEGFCNVLACLVLQALPAGYDPSHRIDSMFANPDPVYGGQFRNQWDILQKLGWAVYEQRIRLPSRCRKR